MRYAGELCALGTAACWATGSNLFTAAGRRVGSRVLNRLRLVAALGFLVLALLVVRHAPWPWWATSGQVALLAASGVVGFVFGDNWNFRALVILGPGRGAVLAATAPIFTTLLAWPLLHERPGPLAMLGILLTVGGVMLVRFESGPGAAPHREGSVAMGVVAGLLGALGQAGGYVLSKLALRSGLDPLSATVIRSAAATLAIWALAVARGEARGTVAALSDRGAAGFIVAGACFGPFLGVTLSLAALNYIQAGVAASITAIYPIGAMLIAARFHREALTWRNLLGAMVAVGGVVVLFLR